ncbi:RodZ domain-containing protein [Gilvimarinus chinensis]|uniref:RodZ domain-containing protein n=1 Tax=Gilvimarinus chinensis TaxID=396005 RepID=UPI0003679104|nr:RodZ domain-containing protein [Gilvimarinus chinensis]
MTQPESLTELEPGPMLRAERERQGISSEQVCTELNIQPNKLKALEAGEYEKMFSVVFTRGYIRSYAKFLGIDSAPLVERFDQLAPSEAQPLPASESLNVKMGGKRSNWAGRLVMVIIILVLWGLAYWYFAADNDLSPAAVSNEAEPEQLELSNASDITRLDSPANSAEQANPYELSFEPASNAELEESPEQELGNSISSEMTAVSAPSEEAAVLSDSQESLVSESEAAPQLDPATDTIALAFSLDCWVRVRDAEGEVLLETLQEAGSSVELFGVAPFQIRLGNAEGVSARVNGNAVQVPSSTTGNVVNFVAGSDQ